MSPDTLTALVNLGSAGAVIAVVVIFLKFLGKADENWRVYLKELREDDRLVQLSREQAFAARNDQVIGEIKNLAENIRSMQEYDNLHHSAMTIALQDMKQTIPARKKAPPGA
ncbi:MAG: hypothetical protein IMZ62_07455 [Chloroflexi bacterium]|nr:hypothetical protein [Chloroflexota bacterium]